MKMHTFIRIQNLDDARQTRPMGDSMRKRIFLVLFLSVLLFKPRGGKYLRCTLHFDTDALHARTDSLLQSNRANDVVKFCSLASSRSS